MAGPTGRRDTGADGAPWKAVVVPGLLLGIGLGGFVDGIVLHQLLRWHHLLSSVPEHSVTTVEGLNANTVADGLFHTATWLAAVAGVVALWRARRTTTAGAGPAGRHLLGWTLAGWGLFNLVEGLVNHHLLQIHHVREGVDATAAYDLGFLLFGAALLIGGAALGRSTVDRRVVDVRRSTDAADIGDGAGGAPPAERRPARPAPR